MPFTERRTRANDFSRGPGWNRTDDLLKVGVQHYQSIFIQCVPGLGGADSWRIHRDFVPSGLLPKSSRLAYDVYVDDVEVGRCMRLVVVRRRGGHTVTIFTAVRPVLSISQVQLRDAYHDDLDVVETPAPSPHGRLRLS